jgi:hypothetical protein
MKGFGLDSQGTVWMVETEMFWQWRAKRLSQWTLFTVPKKTEITALGIRSTDHATPFYPQKLALTSPTRGGRSVGILHSRTKATELLLPNSKSTTTGNIVYFPSSSGWMGYGTTDCSVPRRS